MVMVVSEIELNIVIFAGSRKAKTRKKRMRMMTSMRLCSGGEQENGYEDVESESFGSLNVF